MREPLLYDADNSAGVSDGRVGLLERDVDG
jgi:hypothetical protein